MTLLLGKFGEMWLTVEDVSLGGKLELQSLLQLLYNLLVVSVESSETLNSFRS